MADKKKDGDFKVSDRRLFTSDGELRSSLDEEKIEEQARPEPARAEAAQQSQSAKPGSSVATDTETPPPPSASEQQAQHDAYWKSARDLDRQVELGGHTPKELEVSFERFIASLYMTAMLQLGLMHEQGGQPAVDLIGARQTIDTLGMLSEKTKGNLTSKEQSFVQNCLYELRMAYVEVTNALARAPQAPGPSSSNG